MRRKLGLIQRKTTTLRSSPSLRLWNWHKITCCFTTKNNDEQTVLVCWRIGFEFVGGRVWRVKKDAESESPFILQHEWKFFWIHTQNRLHALSFLPLFECREPTHLLFLQSFLFFFSLNLFWKKKGNLLFLLKYNIKRHHCMVFGILDLFIRTMFKSIVNPKFLTFIVVFNRFRENYFFNLECVRVWF